LLLRSAMNAPVLRFGALAAAATLAGIVLSGPVAMLLVALTYPQPPWLGAEAFALSHHWVQTLPYYFGFLLDGGSVALIAALHALAPNELKARTGAALAFAGAFAALIFFNYAVQTTFVPVLAAEYDAAKAPIISALSMANPRSLAWALEMWGYAVLGVATWLVAPVFAAGRLERATAWLFVANGPVSIAGGFWTAAQPGWVMSPVGLAMFALWNLLMVVLVAFALAAFRRRAVHAARSSVPHRGPTASGESTPPRLQASAS